MGWLKWQWVFVEFWETKMNHVIKEYLKGKRMNLVLALLAVKYRGTDGLRMDFSSFTWQASWFHSFPLLFWTAFFYGVNRISVYAISMISHHHVSVWVLLLPLLLYSVSETWLNSKSWCLLIFVAHLKVSLGPLILLYETEFHICRFANQSRTTFLSEIWLLKPYLVSQKKLFKKIAFLGKHNNLLQNEHGRLILK